ncbi:MAG: hypothetical protein AAFN30_07495 [Actinomycetota bacterium]
MPKRLLFAVLSLSVLAAACGADTEVVTESGAADTGASELTADAAVPVADEPAATEGDAGDDLARAQSGDDAVAGSPPPVLASGDAATFTSAVTSAAAYQTGQFEGVLQMTGANPADPEATVEMTVSGRYDAPAQALDLTMDLGGLMAGVMAGDSTIPPGLDSMFDEPLRMIVIGEESWLQWSLLSMLTGNADAWMAATPDDLESSGLGAGVSSGSVDPTSLLADLARAEADVTEVGTETVRGVTTTHWLAAVDVNTLTAELDADERADLEAQLGPLEGEPLPIELWVGVEDGLLYRYRITMTGSALDDEAGGTGEVGEVVMTFELFDHGQPVEISAPPADKIIDGGSLFSSMGTN